MATGPDTAGANGVFDEVTCLRREGTLEHGELEIADHRHQQVVEVVRNPSRKHAQALQLLGVEKTSFELDPFLLRALALGDVTDDALGSQGDAVLVVVEMGREGGIERGTVAFQQYRLEITHAPLGLDFTQELRPF